MFTILSTFLFFIHLHCSMGEDKLLMTTGYSKQNTKTAECVLKLSAKYFVEEKALSGSIVIININSFASSTQGLLLQTIHSGNKYSIMVKDSFYPHANASHFPEKAKNYMLILEEKSELVRNIHQLSKLPTWNPLAKAIVYYELTCNETGKDMAIEFIEQLRVHKLYKTIVFISNKFSDQVIAYTWIPYSETNCGGECDSVYILDKCENNTLSQVEKQHTMFPSNMNGCPLIAYAVVAEPYVMPPVKRLTNAPFDDAYEFKQGSEINLLKIISEFMNMTLITRMSEIPENWGMIYSNESATGAYAMLRNELTDLVVGNIEVTRTLRKWFHTTVSYLQDEMTFCTPKARQAATWDNLVIIFQCSTWLAILSSLLVMALVFHYLHYKQHNGKVSKWPTKSLLKTFGMLLGWGATFGPKSSTFRILIFAWLCFSINMGISYESFLRIFLMHPRFEKQISTEADLIQSGIPLGGRKIYRSYFETNNASSFYLYQKYNSTTFMEGIRRTALERNFAVVSSRRQAVYQDQKLGKGTPLIYCFSESNNMYKYNVAILARRWFPMFGRFNKIIHSVCENGLIDKWNKELLLHTANLQGASAILPLSIQHLLGAFMLVGILYAASMFIFLCELLIGVILKKKMIRGNNMPESIRIILGSRQT